MSFNLSKWRSSGAYSESEDSDDAYKTVQADFATNLVGALLLASAAMVAEAQTTLQPVDVDPGKTSTEAVEPREPSRVIAVTIDEDGAVTIDGRELGHVSKHKDDFASMLKNAVNAHDDYRVRIAPERRAAWQAILDVHEIVKSTTDKYETVAEAE